MKILEAYEDEKFMLVDPIGAIQQNIVHLMKDSYTNKQFIKKEALKMKTLTEIQTKVKSKIKKPELLAPAGNLEKLKIAVHYGADAVFLGGQEYGLRSNADNFTMAEIKEGVEFANQYNAKYT